MPTSEAQRPSSSPNFSPAKTANAPGERTAIGRSLVIKGEVSGSESLHIDGRIEGSVDFPGHSVTIGAQGTVTANLSAREVLILGKVQGNIEATDRVEIRNAGSLTGDVVTHRISVEDGAILRGSVQIRAIEKKTDRLRPVAGLEPQTEQLRVEPPATEQAAIGTIPAGQATTEATRPEPAKAAQVEQPRAVAAAAGAGSAASAHFARHTTVSDFEDRARKLIKAGYKPKDAVELLLQDTALECRNDQRVMEQERSDAEDFLQKIRTGAI